MPNTPGASLGSDSGPLINTNPMESPFRSQENELNAGAAVAVPLSPLPCHLSCFDCRLSGGRSSPGLRTAGPNRILILKPEVVF